LREKSQYTVKNYRDMLIASVFYDIGLKLDIY
jgi:hypothetical protein